MSKEVPWNQIIINEFIKLSCLSDDEKDVLITRCIDHMTIREQSFKLGMSESKISKIISRLKAKYDDVQPYSDILPIRKNSVEETYLDEH